MKSRMVNALNATPELGYSGAGVTEKRLPILETRCKRKDLAFLAAPSRTD